MRLNKIDCLKPIVPIRQYGEKWEDLEFGNIAQSFIKRCDPLLSDSLKLKSGY